MSADLPGRSSSPEPTLSDARVYSDPENQWGDIYEEDDGLDEDVDPCNYCPHDNTDHAGDGCRWCPCDVPQ